MIRFVALNLFICYGVGTIESSHEQEKDKSHWRDFISQSLAAIHRQQLQHQAQDQINNGKNQDQVVFEDFSNKTGAGAGAGAAWRNFADNLDKRLNELWTATTNTSRIKHRVSTAFAALMNGTVSGIESPKVPFTMLHYTDELTLERLYRLLRAEQQARLAGYGYKVIYWIPHNEPWPKQCNNDLNLLKDLLAEKDSLYVVDLSTLNDTFPHLMSTLSHVEKAEIKKYFQGEYLGSIYHKIIETARNASDQQQQQDASDSNLESDKSVVNKNQNKKKEKKMKMKKKENLMTKELFWLVHIDISWIGNLPKTLARWSEGSLKDLDYLAAGCDELSVGKVCSDGTDSGKNNNQTTTTKNEKEVIHVVSNISSTNGTTGSSRNPSDQVRKVVVWMQRRWQRLKGWLRNFKHEEECVTTVTMSCHPQLLRVSGGFLGQFTSYILKSDIHGPPDSSLSPSFAINFFGRNNFDDLLNVGWHDGSLALDFGPSQNKYSNILSKFKTKIPTPSRKTDNTEEPACESTSEATQVTMKHTSRSEFMRMEQEFREGMYTSIFRREGILFRNVTSD